MTILDEEIGRLPEKYRGPIVSCHLQGKTTEEAARELGAGGDAEGPAAAPRELLQARLRSRGITAPAVTITMLASSEVVGAVVPQTLGPRTIDAVLSFVGRGSNAISTETLQLANGLLMSQMIHRLVWWVAGLAAAVLLGGGAAAFLSTAPDTPGAEPDAPQVVEKGNPDLEVAKAARDNGDPLPPGPVARPGTTRVRPGARVSSISISPNGRLLATAEEGGNVRLWEVSTGREVAVLRKAYPYLHGAVFSPNSKTLAVVDRHDEIALWDVASGKEKRRWKTPGHHLVAFAPDGKTLASGGVSRVVCFWDSSTGKLVRQMKLRLHGFRATSNSRPTGSSSRGATAAMCSYWRGPQATNGSQSR